ncbi:MAG: Gfo/Idh/MocA family oxidoreductase [Thermoflavifilum sp.]|uniref:Gfo/Idh/MocA family protein n=1 Tax=Thermoflavifilum sp. TaxID=1968839 RepID=UPI0018A45D1D|nr:Gfo/Idh/MocA family oxidoreductase [Thermoflavifilum sp.]QOR75634.1 MAG: Gfo/Idh/MocA family oxidoreductase [Thermoflavifilum sp.]
MQKQYSRRSFVKSGVQVVAGAYLGSLLPFQILADTRRKTFALDQLRVAAIGINGMGWADLQSMLKHPHAQVVALCDVDENVLNRRKAELQKANITVDTYVDYERILDRKDIDAVIIGTPDHWHCKIMVDACSAGKHVYCEKPVGRTIAECRVMVAAQQRYGTVVQVGQWQRSMQHFRDAVDYVQSGKLGKIRLVKAWAYIGWKSSIPVLPDQPVPPGVHYEKWLGPAPERPFNPNRFHFNFRWFFDYAGGLMTDWGVHLIDYALLAMKAGYPERITAMGGKFGFPHDAEEWPDTMTALFDYGSFAIQWEQTIGINGGPYQRDHGVAYIGENGTLVLDRGGWEVIPEQTNHQYKIEPVPRQQAVDQGLDKHTYNFVEAAMANRPDLAHAPITAGSHVAEVCHMGNIAWLTGEVLHWDASQHQFREQQANTWMTPEYHHHIRFPQV